MDKRISELRDRLWKKKAALQQKENLPVSIFFLPQTVQNLIRNTTDNFITFSLNVTF